MQWARIKSGKFGHQVNSVTHLQTVEIQMRRLLIPVCLVNLFFIPIIEPYKTNKVTVQN